MAKIEVSRVELVWPGKYHEDGTPRRASVAPLPSQVAATYGDAGPEGWRNRLFWGDSLYAMAALRDELAGKVDLVYLDPPFATGADFFVAPAIGDTEPTGRGEQPPPTARAYSDSLGLEAWLQLMYERLPLVRELLAPTGALYLHCDYRLAFHLRLLLDEVFGPEHFQNQIVWHYSGWNRHGERAFNRRHDQILYYSKTARPAFNSLAEPWASAEEYVRVRKQKLLHDEQGRPYVLSDAGGGRRVRRFLAAAMAAGRPADDVWDLDKLNNSSREALGYPTQKPEALLERIIRASSDEGGLVADFFCGSGTALAVAERLGRRWVGADLGRLAVHTARKRILALPGHRPFALLDLGRAECRHRCEARFGPDEGGVAAYRAHILRCYGATPLDGGPHLHGSLGAALVAVGSPDTPVAGPEARAALAACVRLGRRELHLLGWEWEPDLPDTLPGEAARCGVELLLLTVPREVLEPATAAGLTFFEPARLSAVVAVRGRAAEVTLTGFALPRPERLPAAIRARIHRWSDYVDYWAIDWEAQGDSFRQGWAAYRARGRRALALQSDGHTYAGPGRYTLRVIAIDIFGQTTSRDFSVEVA